MFCAVNQRADLALTDLFPHQTPFQIQRGALIRSRCYFYLVLVTFQLVCVVVKMSKLYMFCTVSPLFQQSTVPPAVLLQLSEYIGKWFRVYPQNSESFEHVYL